MNGWSNWEKDDQGLGLGNESLSFFDNKPKDLNSVAPPTKSPRCTDSNQCGSGYACIGGECVSSGGSPGTTAPSTYFPDPAPGTPSPGSPTGGSPDSGPGRVYPPKGAGYPDSSGSGAGSGGTSGCGWDPDPGSGNNTTSPCRPDTGGDGCTKTGCGDRDRANDCCGEERCCRYTGAGVQCWCGACPPPDEPCNRWCDITKSATGDLSPGCEGEKTCDECSECGITTGTCDPTPDGPCNCPESACNKDACNTCGEDGVCKKDCNNCVARWTRNYACECGTVTQYCYRSACNPGLTHCSVPDCSGLCKDLPDPCEGNCSTTTICDGSDFFCPSYASCSVVGNINTPSAECTIYQVCDKRNLPEKCEECDCNCEDDCPDCKICNSAGKCVDDPECDENYTSRWVLSSETYSYQGCNYDFGTGLGGCAGEVFYSDTGDINVTSSCGPMPHSLKQTRTPVLDPKGPCLTGASSICWHIQDANTAPISSEFCSDGVSGSWCGGPDPDRSPVMVDATKC